MKARAALTPVEETEQNTRATNVGGAHSGTASNREKKQSLFAAGAIFMLGTLLLLAGQGIAAKNSKIADSVPPWSSDGKTKTVRTDRVKLEVPTEKLKLFGTTRAAKRSKLGFTIPGKLKTRNFNVGDKVKVGQILALLDSRAPRNARQAAKAQLSQVESQWQQAKRDKKRASSLVKAKATAGRRLEQAKTATDSFAAARRAAKSQLSEANRVLSETVLRAPYDATVAAVLFEPGEIVAAGHPIFLLSSEERLEVVVGVPENFIADLKKGTAVLVDLPLAQEENIRATVKSVGRAAPAAGYLFPAILTMQHRAGVVAGMSAEVVFHRRRPQTLTVPIGAVFDPTGNAPALFRLRGGKAERIAITTGKLYGERVSIKGPLAAGDRIITGGLASLISGDSVESVQ
jgi:membrane fusion protein, multidrug efflux system